MNVLSGSHERNPHTTFSIEYKRSELRGNKTNILSTNNTFCSHHAQKNETVHDIAWNQELSIIPLKNSITINQEGLNLMLQFSRIPCPTSATWKLRTVVLPDVFDVRHFRNTNRPWKKSKMPCTEECFSIEINIHTALSFLSTSLGIREKSGESSVPQIY